MKGDGGGAEVVTKEAMVGVAVVVDRIESEKEGLSMAMLQLRWE